MHNINLKRGIMIMVILSLFAVLGGADGGCDQRDQEQVDAMKVNDQQQQYAKTQPIPFFDFSRERAVYTQIYQARNRAVATHTVWRGDMSIIEGDCMSIGFPLPYDVQLTNPLKTANNYQNSPVIEQAEPNGLFSSKTTAATWIMCAVEDQGVTKITPVYVEGKVTAYPYPVRVDYDKNRVYKLEGGKSSVLIK